MKEKKSFNRYLFLLTIPIILQNLVTTALNLLDTVMIGRVGEVELAAVGIANQFYFLYSLFILGIAGGCGVLVAQLWGGQDKSNIKKVTARALLAAIGMTVVFVLAGSGFSEWIIQLFNDDPQIVSTGADYLRITLLGYLFTSITFVFSSSLRSINNTRIPMYASVFGLMVNGVLNYILIFGKLGIEPMYAQGAAIATLTARTLECLMLIYMTYKAVPELSLSMEDFKGLSDVMKKALEKVTFPILLNEACWGFGMVTYVALYAHLGTKATAAMQICSTIMNLFMVIAFGLSYAALVVVGNEVGAGKGAYAMQLSQNIRKLALKISLVLALALFGISEFSMTFFNVSPEVKQMAAQILMIYSLMLPLRMMNMLMIVGILRGGGDAFYGTVLQGSVMWLLGIPLTFVVGYVLKMPVPLVVGTSFVEEVVKGLLIQKRYREKKWIKVIFTT